MKKQLSMWLPAALLLTLLPGCPVIDWFKEQFGYKKPYAQMQQHETGNNQAQAEGTREHNENAVVLANGEVAVSQSEFEQNLEAMKQSQPEIQQVLAFTPAEQQKQLYGQIADMLANQYVLMRYVHEQGLDQTQEYQKNYRILMDQMEKTLASQVFQSQLYQDMQQDISDKEARDYYRNNAATMAMFQPDVFIKEPGGIKSSIVKADNPEQARQIADKAKQSDLKTAAREFDKSSAFQDLGVVTQQSTTPNREVVSKIMSLQNASSFPQIDVVNSYVVSAQEKVEPTYAEFENVKDQVKNYMLSERFQNYYNEKISELRDKYGVTTNEDALNAFVTAQSGGQDEQPE